ncbi:MAG: MATE family efflux transporter [Lachnospiraceae bacterium]|nr:MATE family efflux transporter [Lachnospiraceae bacterium]
MTQTPVRRLIITLAIPTIISMLVTGIYNTADTYFVGRISTNATAAVGVVFPLMSIIQALGFFCGHGSGNYVSRKLGAGDMKESGEMAATGFTLAFLIGIVFSLICLITQRPLASLMGALPAIMEDTLAYMRIILIGAPFMMAQLVINNQLRFQGSAVYAMIGLVSGAVLNIGLDPLFIFTFGLGVSGAALATILSQMVSFSVLLLGNLRNSPVPIDLKKVRLNTHYLGEIINGGSPSLARQGMGSISSVLLNSAAGSLGGEAAIAGMSIVTRVMMLAMSALIGFGQGFQPVCSFNYGAKKFDRVREGYWFCVKYSFVFLVLVAIPGILFSPQIIAFFRDDPEVIAVGKVALRCQAFVFAGNAFIVISNMFLQSIGKGVRATILASSRSGLFMIPAILILPRLFGLFGVEIAQTCADICTLLITFPLTMPVLREMQEKAGA